MKKALSLLMALTVGSMMILTGCGDKPYDYDLTEYITVGEYKGLEYEKPEEITVSKQEIKAAIKEDLEGAKALKDVEDGKVHDGDTVNIDFTGKVDGKEFEGGSAKGSSLEIGSKSFIDGFEDGLIGKKVGETVTLNLQFPKKYEQNPDLAGKDVVFEVKINASQRYVTPTEEEYVKENSKKYKSVDDYEKAVEKELISKKEEEQKGNMQQYLWGLISEASKVKEYPEKEVKEYKEKIKSDIQEYAKKNSMEFEDVIQSSYGMTEKEFNKELEKAAKENSKEQMIVYYIAREENIEVKGSEYDEFIDKQLDAMGYTAEDFEKYTGSSYEEYVGGEEYLRYFLLYQKVMDFVVENAKAVDKLSDEKK